MRESMNSLSNYCNTVFKLVLFWGIVFLCQSCNPNIEDSPDPGVLRIILQSSNEDTSLVIAGETLSITDYYIFQISGDSTISDSLVMPEKDTLIVAGQVFTVVNDTLVVTGDNLDTTLVISDTVKFFIGGDTVTVTKNNDINVFNVSVFQGKVYHDSLYAILFTGLSKYRTETNEYNLLAQVGGRYKQFIIYESYVPPGDYNVIEFGLTASQISLGVFNSPIELPENESSLVKLFENFEVFEGGVTELNVQVYPLASLTRYRDSFIFDRVIEVNKINYY